MHHQPTWEKILPVGLSEKYQVNKTNGFDANTVDLPPQVSPSLTQLREDKTQILAKMLATFIRRAICQNEKRLSTTR
jgi:hypothetical protein